MFTTAHTIRNSIIAGVLAVGLTVGVTSFATAGNRKPSHHGNSSSSSSATATVKPVITGTRSVGETVSVTAATWSVTPDSTSIQWFRDGHEIAGANTPTYIVSAADSGETIFVREIAVFGTKTKKTTSNVVQVEALTELLVRQDVTISGVTAVGETLTVSAGIYSADLDSVTYQWYRDDVAIEGATGTTYVVTEADLGTQIRVIETPVKAGYHLDDSAKSNRLWIPTL